MGTGLDETEVRQPWQVRGLCVDGFENYCILECDSM